MQTLKQINKEYEEIIHSDVQEPYRIRKLAQLMTEMEQDHKVSLLRDEAWEC